MRSLIRLGAAVAIATAAAATIAGPASASGRPGTARPDGRAHRQLSGHRLGWQGHGRAVFVQTDNTAGNQVVAYHRTRHGALTWAGTYPTGGLGGVLTGSVVDHLASQGSLGYDRRRNLLYAVNAGSSSVSVFGMHGDRLFLRQVLPSGGTFPVSIARRGDLVYVLNAEKGGSVQGYRVRRHELAPIPGSNRALDLNPVATPQFTNTPGQVAFSPGGSQLIVTTKANGNDIDVFAVRPDGRLSASPVVNPEPGTVPFGVAFDRAGHLVVAEAGPNALATFELLPDGSVTLIDSVPNGQAATCWVTPANGYLFASNAGSGTVSGYSSGRGGALALLGETGTDAGTVDSAATPGGRFLYVQAGGSGIVDEFAIRAGGSLAEIGSVTVPGAAGGEGIVAA